MLKLREKDISWKVFVFNVISLVDLYILSEVLVPASLVLVYKIFIGDKRQV